MGMGFQPNPLVPQHLVELSESDIAEIIEVFQQAEQREPEHWHVTAGGPKLKAMFEGLPGLYNDEGASWSDNLSERGKQALERMVVGVRLRGLMNVHRPGATTELIEELAAAIREQEIAEAHLTVSLYEGHPGPERSAIVKRDRAAKDALSEVALRYGLAVMERGERENREQIEEIRRERSV